jgi:hypothetical protein
MDEMHHGMAPTTPTTPTTDPFSPEGKDIGRTHTKTTSKNRVKTLSVKKKCLNFFLYISYLQRWLAEVP